MIIQRTEVKYLLSIHDYHKLRLALMPFTEIDGNVEQGADTYSVHSVYYDSLNLKNYRDKVEGEDQRAKFRIRFYKNNLNLDDHIWTELKQKKGPIIKKIRSQMALANLNLFLNGRSDNSKENSLLYHIYKEDLSPKVTVSYKRKALVGKFEHYTRITFDSFITGCETNSFTTREERKNFLLDPRYFILEIKTDDSVPTWLSHIIERFGLTQVAFSKYGRAIESCVLRSVCNVRNL